MRQHAVGLRFDFSSLVFLTVIFAIAPITTAQAYLDPVTGSFLLQGLAGGVLALGVAFRKHWRALTQRLVGKKGGTNHTPSQPDDDRRA